MTTTTTTTTASPSYGRNIYLYDGVIKANHIVEQGASTIANLETNRPETDLVYSEVTDSTFDSAALSTLQSFLAVNFNVNDFIYKHFPITNTGSGKVSWFENEIRSGMLYMVRYGIGYFYFLNVTNDDVVDPVPAADLSEEITPEIKYWDYLTTFWDYLK